jgi:hypothetical protein
MEVRWKNTRIVGLAPVVALLFWLLGLAVAMGGISAPYSYAVLSPNGKRILVMLSPIKVYDSEFPTKFKLPSGRLIVVGESFPKSGVYDATTLLPVWQCSWYVYHDDLRWSDGFDDLAILNRFALTSGWGIAFYHQGQFVRSYDCQYLLTEFRNPIFLPYTTWDWHTRWEENFERDGNHILLSTARRRLTYYGYELEVVS